jgi:hypothetical protein
VEWLKQYSTCLASQTLSSHSSIAKNKIEDKVNHKGSLKNFAVSIFKKKATHFQNICYEILTEE